MSKLVLFTGGARSGKSSSAELYASRLSDDVVYLATAEAGDDEMRSRIAEHRRRRPSHWTTVEARLEVAAVCATLAPGTVVLLDCLALLVSNLLLANQADPQPAVEAEVSALLAVVVERDLSLVAVTNEVGMGIVPAYPLGRVYRDVLGWANQRVARGADEVYVCVCGIPVELRALQAAWARR